MEEYTTDSVPDRAPVLAVDLDETIIQSDTEELIPGALDALKHLKDSGWKIIIWTCRGDIKDRVPEVLERHGVPYDAINENLPGIRDKSRKIMFDAVVDNKNVDFGDGWESIVRELEKRRDGWRATGITKACIHYLDPYTQEETVLQEWSLDESGCAVLKSGMNIDLDELGVDLATTPNDGELFLKDISRSVNNTYLFATVARGQQFMFSPKKKAKTKFDENCPSYLAVFEGLVDGETHE